MPAVAACAEEYAGPCDDALDIPVTVTPRFDEPAYDYSVGLADVQALAGDTRHAVHGGHTGLTLGLTRYDPIMQVTAPVRAAQFEDGSACARIDHVDVIFGYKDVTVYIPREIPQASCGFNEVIAHERKHLAVNRKILDDYAPVITAKIKDYLRTSGVFREQNVSYALSLVRDKLQAILNEISGEVFAENSRRQQDVDNPGEYRRIAMSCNGQLAVVAMRFRRTGQ